MGDWALLVSVLALAVSGSIGVAQYRLNRRVHWQTEAREQAADLYVSGRWERVMIDFRYDRVSDVCIYAENRGSADAANVVVTSRRPRHPEGDFVYPTIERIAAHQFFRIGTWELEDPEDDGTPFTMSVQWHDGRGEQERTMTVTHYERS